MGWGDIFGIINKWLPSKEEYNRNKIDKLMREQNDLLKKEATPANRSRLSAIADELGRLYSQAKNK